VQTNLAEFIRDTPEGREADAILRSCVHCGFCTATCPTYQLLGDELDGPRGRIYLIKQALEGQTVTDRTRLHLDRCLTCRSCETTCPSGVRYHRLLDIGREVVERQTRRPWHERLARSMLLRILPHPRRFGLLLGLGQRVRPILPAALRAKVPVARDPGPLPARQRQRQMLLLAGCVQPSSAPTTNAATARVLDRLGIQALTPHGAGCCGAASHHLSAVEQATAFMRRNIDAWWPHIEAGAEAVVMTASGCGAHVKAYGELMADDPVYAERAARVSALTRDLGEVLAAEDLAPLGEPGQGRRIAFHAPCTLQHGQQLGGVVEGLLTRLGYTLTTVPDAHLCCGSAGTYSLLQPTLAQRLLVNKLAALEGDGPELIASANIGCQVHLATRARVPVRHWVELLDTG
jgi:glycolate oxidase iron-sulfur subunit